ncbi:unnamed protein product [Caenorhabditis nigoni]
MPINILSLPDKDLQYALKSMDICSLIAFSVCSKRTESLVKSSNRKINPISGDVCKWGIRLAIRPKYLLEFENITDQLFIFLFFSNPLIKIYRGNRFENWKELNLSQREWAAHLLSIFNESMIYQLEVIEVCPISHLDTIKQFIPRCQTLRIQENCPGEFAKMAFFKLSSIAEKVVVPKNIFDNGNDISKALSLSLKSMSFIDWRNPFKLESSDLLVLNITDLSIRTANITFKELNRFLKLWMKSNHICYRPKRITIGLDVGINPEEVLQGIKYDVVDEDGSFRLKRTDGEELLITTMGSSLLFNFGNESIFNF